jgi:hypothetical protein
LLVSPLPVGLGCATVSHRGSSPSPLRSPSPWLASSSAPLVLPFDTLASLCRRDTHMPLRFISRVPEPPCRASPLPPCRCSRGRASLGHREARCGYQRVRTSLGMLPDSFPTTTCLCSAEITIADDLLCSSSREGSHAAIRRNRRA